MDKIILCSSTAYALSDVDEILRNVKAFELITCENGIEAGVALYEKEKADLLIVNLEDLHDNANVDIMKLQTEKGGKILAFGTTLKYTEFLAKYLGDPIGQLEKPAEAMDVLKTVTRALDMAPEVQKAILNSYSSAYYDNRPKVMIVDDNAVLLRSLRAVLKEEYRVSVSSSGKAALKALKKNKPDLMLLDYEMPEMDGREVLENIRNNPETKDMKVLFLTSVNDKDMIRAAMKLKPEGYLLKPMENELLMKAINAALQDKSANALV
ncbi:MAG: response regulator transcription factor [Lachnospiraceae bacterium]|nr:response regulator transcription factor [Lachnospiraceae bacterium]